ncbi:MAG: GatB/YqeY domain-containing protein [Patescibacteria group bacterium]
MSIQQNIREELKEAMKARDQVRSLVLKGLISAFMNELVAQKKKPQEDLPDTDALNVIKRAVKQRKDSIEQYGKGGREDLVANEKDELAILETYLPAMMNEEQIKKIALAKKTEMEEKSNLPAGKAGMGILMRAVMGQIKSAGEEADGALVKKVVENLF